MKLKHTFAAALLAVAAQAAASPPMARLAPATRIALLAESGTPASRGDSDAEDNPEAPYRALMLMISGEEVVDSLLAKGVVIYNRRDDILLTSVPKDSLSVVLGLDGLMYASSTSEISRCLDKARDFCFVDAVQRGASPLARAFDGSGVVAGFSDIGFDATHIAFRGRVALAADYNTGWARVRKASTATAVEAWGTDNPDQYHATHVANILAGGWKGNPYYGVAPGARIVATTSDLHDSGILAGVEDVISYARAAGMPAVINLSLSNYIGPHDGTDLFCRYISACARDAVICLSAGNNGRVNGFATQQLDQSHPAARVMVNTLKGWNGFEVKGYTDIWAENATPLRVRAEVYDIDTGQIVYASGWTEPYDDGTVLLIVDTESTPEWARYFEGTVIAAGELCPLNDRYNITVMYDTRTLPVSEKGEWSKYYTCIAVERLEGEPPVTVDIFADATTSYLGNVQGSPAIVSSRGSINDLATAYGVIAVGACSTRNSAPLLTGGEVTWKFLDGEVAAFSSYSDVATIAPLPHFCAPGNYTVSALSHWYEQLHPVSTVTAATESDGTRYCWFPACGTSMASPFAAGVFALWLQADPTLDASALLDIARRTARTDLADIADPRWGAGCIDAMAGLQEILNGSGIISPESRLHVWVDGDRRLRAIGAEPGDLQVRHISGCAVDASSALTPGIYIVGVAASGSPAVKILVK